MQVAFSYAWSLSHCTPVEVRRTIEQLRSFAISIGSINVSEVNELCCEGGLDSHSSRGLKFDATLPNTQTPQTFGLTLQEDNSFGWSGSLSVSSFREISILMHSAAELGIEVTQGFAGMIIALKRDGDGVVQVEQCLAFNLDDF
jgi:hypothetical protein